jgi:hypothetical protein
LALIDDCKGFIGLSKESLGEISDIKRYAQDQLETEMCWAEQINIQYKSFKTNLLQYNLFIGKMKAYGLLLGKRD